MDYSALSDILFGISKFGIETLIFLLSLYTSKTVVNNYNIKKDYKNRNMNNVLIKPDTIQKAFKIDTEKFNKSEYYQAVLEFCKFLITNYPKEYLINFYNNINDLNITNDKKISFAGMSGTYLPLSNRIKIDDSSSIYHELFHMSSRLYDDYNEEKVYCGFRQIAWENKYSDIGTSINEGYTELLAHRYFGKSHQMPVAYKNEINVVSIIEKIIDKETMEKLYFTANLPDLITLLEQYLKREEILDFITRLDIITKYSNNSFLDRNAIIEENISVIWEFLLKIYTIKLKENLDKHIIDEELFVDKSLKHIKFLKKNITVGCYKYDPLELVPMIENWESVLSKTKSKKLVK